MAANPIAGFLASAGKLLQSLKASVPFLKKLLPEHDSAEPFASIEDGTPIADVHLAPNVAQIARRKPGSPAIDLRAILASAVSSVPLLIGLACLLLLILAIAIAGVLVAAPPKDLAGKAEVSREGEALARKFILPPGSALETRMEMEREGPPVFGDAEAARLRSKLGGIDLSAIAARNDAAIGELLGAAK